MIINEQIAILRKAKGLSQEQLANKLNISNQAVSKWESGLNCPDINLIPSLAAILSVSISKLFGEDIKTNNRMTLEDNSLNIEGEVLLDESDDIRIVVMKNDNIIKYNNLTQTQKKNLRNFTIQLNGNCNSLQCVCNAKVTGNVNGSVNIGDSLTIEGDVKGSISAGNSVTCGNVEGNISAGDAINCGNVNENVSAGDSVNCGNVEGKVSAGDSVTCGNVNDNVEAKDSVTVNGNVYGNVIAESVKLINKD